MGQLNSKRKSKYKMNPCLFLAIVTILFTGLVKTNHLKKSNSSNLTSLFTMTNQTDDATNGLNLMRNAQHDNHQFVKWPNGIVPYVFDYTTLSQHEAGIIQRALAK